MAILVSLSSALLTGYAKAAGPVLYVDDTNGNIGTVDLSTQAVNILGNADTGTVHTNILTDIAFDSNGNLWGVNPAGNLYSLNKTTGAATLVGFTGVTTRLNALVGGKHGVLWAAANGDNNLYTINTSTGLATTVANIGFSSVGDLAWVNGTLYESSDGTAAGNLLVAVDVSTDKATEIGSMGITNVYGLASDGTDTLYAVANTQIYTVNLSTAALTPVFNYGSSALSDSAGLAFVDESAGAGGGVTPPPPPPAVPLPASVWSGLSLLGGLGVFAFIRRRIAAFA